MKPLATSFQKNGPFVCPFALSDARVQARSRRACRSLRALHQLHFKRRILGSRECESAGIDRDENGVNALLGVSYSIDSGGTVGQRSCVRTSLLCTTPDSSTSSRCLQTFRQTVERPNIIRVLCTPLNSTPLNPKSSQQTSSAPL